MNTGAARDLPGKVFAMMLYRSDEVILWNSGEPVTWQCQDAHPRENVTSKTKKQEAPSKVGWHHDIAWLRRVKEVGSQR